MHDPLTVAFEVCRPWPRRSQCTLKSAPRWSFRGRFWQLAGRRYYWPSLITVWHVEPGGHDSGDVCKHYRRDQQADGKWKTTMLRGWRFHAHHWRVQVIPLLALRRWALTRCAWCGGRSTETNRLDTGGSWHPPKTRWWQGEADLFHGDCHGAKTARNGCSCEHPITTDRYGECARCGLRTYNRTDLQRAADRILVEMVPKGTAPLPEVMAAVRNLRAVHRANTADALAIEEDLDVDTTTEA